MANPNSPGRQRRRRGEIPVALRAPSISPRPINPAQTGHFYFGNNRTFLIWLDNQANSVFDRGGQNV